MIQECCTPPRGISDLSRLRSWLSHSLCDFASVPTLSFLVGVFSLADSLIGSGRAEAQGLFETSALRTSMLGFSARGSVSSSASDSELESASGSASVQLQSWARIRARFLPRTQLQFALQARL